MRLVYQCCKINAVETLKERKQGTGSPLNLYRLVIMVLVMRLKYAVMFPTSA